MRRGVFMEFPFDGFGDSFIAWTGIQGKAFDLCGIRRGPGTP